MTPAEEAAMAFIRDCVQGRVDAGLAFTSDAFYSQVKRAACALGACGFCNHESAAWALGVTKLAMVALSSGFGNRDNAVEWCGPCRHWFEFGEQMAKLAGLT